MFGTGRVESNSLTGRIIAMAKKRESLIVASKVRAYIKSKKMITSSEVVEATSEAVYSMLDGAIARAKANRRSTVRAQDL
jgi:aryl-alcohol dehydrogenase-like predicted oxidoreductase